MKCCLIIILLGWADYATAVSIFMEIVPPRLPGPSGRIEIIVDNSPEGIAFRNGGIDLGMRSTSPGVIKFMQAVVYTPVYFGGAPTPWTSGIVRGITDDEISLLRVVSLNSPGLDASIPWGTAGGSQFMFAGVDFEYLGGRTTIELFPASGADSFVHLGNRVPVELRNLSIIPEPATLAMCGMGMTAFVLRRRDR